MRRAEGFTLIELMMVMAIIGSLMAIALPAYNGYVAKTQVIAGLANISSGKMGFEERLLAGDPKGFSLADIGLAEQTSRCALSLRSTDDGYIRCTLRGNAHVDGYTITVVRTNGGGWHCEMDPAISLSYRPSRCR